MSAPVFRLCTAADKNAIVRFMDEHWGSKHPLIYCEDYFAYYYDNDGSGPATADSDAAAQRPIQFAVAEENGAILALAGYIWTSKTQPRDLWVSIWCAAKGQNGIGLELMEALPRLTGARVMACNNIRPKTMVFYTFLGYTAARLPHYYRLADRAHYAVAHVAHKAILPAHGDATLTLIPDAATLTRDFCPDPALRPHKDAWYLARRYFAFPRQKYAVYGVYEGPAHRLTRVLVTRTVPVNDTAVLRVVDYVGAPERFADLGGAIDKLMQAAKAEYAECYCYGISAEVFASAGFTERAQDDGNIIPNYLTPPLYENTEYYFFTSDPAHFTMFKADGDQDRPNIVL